MAEAILPLTKLNVPPHKAWINGEMKKVSALLKIADALMSAVPGVPDVQQMIEDEIDKRVEEELAKAWKIILAFIVNIAMGLFQDSIPLLNKAIAGFNKLIALINGILNVLKALLTPIFALLTVITVVYIVAKIITFIPSFGGGLGAVVVVTAPEAIASTIMGGAKGANDRIKNVVLK